MANREQREERRYGQRGVGGRSERDYRVGSDWDDEGDDHGDDRTWQGRDDRWSRENGGRGAAGGTGWRSDRDPFGGAQMRREGRTGGRAYGGEPYGERGFGGAYGSGGGRVGGAGRYDPRDRYAGSRGAYGYGDRTSGGRMGGRGGERTEYHDEERGGWDRLAEDGGSATGRGHGSYDESGDDGSRGRAWPNARRRSHDEGLTERAARFMGPFTGRGPKGYQRSDERIREDVCDRLMDEGELDASDMTVEVRGGEVVLEGSVDSKEAKRRAEDIAEEVSGVREVQNRLRVERSSTWGDTAHRGTAGPDATSGESRTERGQGAGAAGLGSGSAQQGVAALGVEERRRTS